MTDAIWFWIIAGIVAVVSAVSDRYQRRAFRALQDRCDSLEYRVETYTEHVDAMHDIERTSQWIRNRYPIHSEA